MNTLYRIYIATAGTSRHNVEKVTSNHFTGFTVTKGTGYWQGQVEANVVIEVLIEDSAEAEQAVGNLVKDLKSKFVQDKVLVVLVVQIPCTASFE